MPPIVSQVSTQDHSDSSSHRELHRALSTVLRVQCEQNSMSPEMLEANKIVGNHLLLAKRSASHHPALTATNSLISPASVAEMNALAGDHQQAGVMDSNGFAVQVARKALVMSNLHRPLDRSQSEPVWQQQQQPSQDKQTNSSRYKTELCRPFEENGFCKYGDKCQFAHGGNEIRTLNRHPKYKTELCRTFHTIGICPYGPRCHFIHNAEESRVFPNAAPLQSAGQALTPPPALIPSPQTHAMSHSMGLASLLDSNNKHSPLNSLHSSPTSPGVFFDEAGSFVFPPNMLLENLAESLASSLQLNNKLNTNGSPNAQCHSFNTRLANHLSKHHQLQDLIPLSSSMDTPPASPPDCSISPSSSLGDDKSSIRLPVFQSLNNAVQ